MIRAALVVALGFGASACRDLASIPPEIWVPSDATVGRRPVEHEVWSGPGDLASAVRHDIRLALPSEATPRMRRVRVDREVWLPADSKHRQVRRRTRRP